MNESLHRELWTSWASLLRSYCAVHSLGRDLHAVVEISPETILVRYGLRWSEFSHIEYRTSEGVHLPLELTENGRIRIGANEDEMDLFAERLASAIIAM